MDIPRHSEERGLTSRFQPTQLLKDEDPVDTSDMEVTKISKKLAETRKAAMAKLTSRRTKKAIPE